MLFCYVHHLGSNVVLGVNHILLFLKSGANETLECYIRIELNSTDYVVSITDNAIVLRCEMNTNINNYIN